MGSLREIPFCRGTAGISGSATRVSSSGGGFFLFSLFASFEGRLALEFLAASSERRGIASVKQESKLLRQLKISILK